MKDKIKSLAKKINKARNSYYNGQSDVTDKLFDAWVDELKSLDPEHQAVTSIGAAPASFWEKVKHEYEMGSLNKINTPEELTAWAEECSATEFLTQDKLDGLSVSLTFKDGKLIIGASRGSGDIGENITQNVLKMQGIPDLVENNFTGNIRGEIILTRSNHKKYFENYSNPRNAASGISRRLDGEGSQHLTVMVYQVASGKEFETEADQFSWLEDAGFKTPKSYLTKSVADIIDIWNQYQKSVRQALDWDVDGLVVRINNLTHQLSLGEKGKKSKGIMAFKFDAEAKETTIRAIINQIGSSGRITPVAEFDPVELAGAIVSRASLYNYSYIRELGIDVNCKVMVIRSNEVIPRIIEVSKSTGTVAQPPSHCPSCSEQIKESGEYLLCINKTSCPALKLGRLQTWVSEIGMMFWADSTLERVINSGLVNDIADLYRLTETQLANMDRFGEKSAEKLIKELDKFRSIKLENLIGGLGITGTGTGIVKLVIDKGFNTLNKLRTIKISELENIPGFGSIRAEALVNGIKENKERIDDICLLVKIMDKIEGNLSGKSVCFTGAAERPRAELQQLVEAAGGTVKNSCTKSTSYLVIADVNSQTSKAAAARKLGVTLISETQLINMIEGN